VYSQRYSVHVANMLQSERSIKRIIRSFRSKVLLLIATGPALGRKHPPIQRAREAFLSLKANIEADCLLSFVAQIKQPLDLYLHFLIILRGIAFV
jgi:hypothetical protein